MSTPGKFNRRIAIEDGAWYVPTRGGTIKPRWVLGVFRSKNDGRVRVRYSTGGEGHRMCLRSSFVYWMTWRQAKKNLEIPIHEQRAEGGVGRISSPSPSTP